MSDIFAVANFMSTLSRFQRLLELQGQIITKQGERIATLEGGMKVLLDCELERSKHAR